MSTLLSRFHSALASLALLAAVAAPAIAQTHPTIPDPSTPNPWSPWSPEKVSTWTSVHAMTETVTITETHSQSRSRTGSFAFPVGAQSCGGSSTITLSGSVELSGFGVTISVEISSAWNSPTADNPCWLCRPFVFVNATQTETKTWGKTTRIRANGDTSVSNWGPDFSYSMTNIGAPTLKLVCDKSQAAVDFCCPPKGKTAGSCTHCVDRAILPGEAFVRAEQRGLTAGWPSEKVDLTDVGSIVTVQLGSVAEDPPAEAGTELWAASFPNQLSLTERVALRDHVYDVLGAGESGSLPLRPNYLVLIDIDGGRHVIDLGVATEAAAEDLFALANPADVDLDGDVDAADLGIVEADIENFLPGCRGDINLDGTADQKDVDIVLAALEH